MNTETNPQTPDEISDADLKMPDQYEAEAPIEKPHSSLGIILGVLIVVLLLILAGLYLWGTTLNNTDTGMNAERPTAEENNEPESMNAEADVETMQALSPSDEISAIEADIEATNLDAIDAELQAIEAELNATLSE